MQQRLNAAEYQYPVIIGGGPAGAAVAIQLARAGSPACLLERKYGAHDKVCGEFISWEAAECLWELGVDLAALGAQPIRRIRLYNSHQMLESALPHTAWSLSRRMLDAALLQQAAQAGVEVRQGVTVRELAYNNDGWTLKGVTKGPHQASSIKASAVFLATGKHDLRNWRRRAPSRQDFIGLKMHFRPDRKQRETLQDTVEIHLFDGGYAGLEPIEQGKLNLCFLIRKEIYTACGKHWPTVFEWLSHRSPQLKVHLADAKPLWPRPLAVYGVPYGYIHSPVKAPPGLFRLGDQTAVIPSFAGDGIAIALHSACLAARVYLENGSAEAYHRQAQRDFQSPINNARLLSHLLARRAGRQAAFQLCRAWPNLITRMIHRTRLGVAETRAVRV